MSRTQIYLKLIIDFSLSTLRLFSFTKLSSSVFDSLKYPPESSAGFAMGRAERNFPFLSSLSLFSLLLFELGHARSGARILCRSIQMPRSGMLRFRLLLESLETSNNSQTGIYPNRSLSNVFYRSRESSFRSDQLGVS